MAKLPAFQFYPGDWMKDPNLRSCSLAARGLWMDMLCLMFASDRRGFLQAPNGTPYSHEQLARMTGCLPDELSRLLAELFTSGVYARTAHGIIFSRRLKREEEQRANQRFRQSNYRRSKKTNENGDADVTHDVTGLSPPSSSSSSKYKNNTPPPPSPGGGDAGGGPSPPLRLLRGGKDQGLKAAVETAWAYYREVFGKTAAYEFTKTRARHAEKAYHALLNRAAALEIPEDKRLEQVITWFGVAIDRMHRSEFHNPKFGKKYCDWENLFRSPDHRSPDHLAMFWLDDERFGKRPA